MEAKIQFVGENSYAFEAQVEFPAKDLRELPPQDFSERYLAPILSQARKNTALFEVSSEQF